MQLPKRTCEEWITIFRTAPAIKTVFAEGPSDARLMRAACGHPDTVDFRSGDELDLGQQEAIGGNRLRVLRLGQAVDAAQVTNVKLLVDKDFGSIASQVNLPQSVTLTDHANTVSSAISAHWFNNFLLRAYNHDTVPQNWTDACAHLRFLFCCRFIVISEKISHNSFNLYKNISINEGRYLLNCAGVIRNYIPLAQYIRDDLLANVTELSDWIQGSPLDFMHSEDLFEYVYAILKRSGKIGGAVSVESIRAAILGSLPLDLGGLPVTEGIRAWCSN